MQAVLHPATGLYPGNEGPDVIVRVDLHQSVQLAVDTTGDANLDGYIIIGVSAHADGSLGGSANQSVVVSQNYGNDKPVALIGCSVTLTGGGSGAAVAVAASANAKDIMINGRTTDIFVMDLHGGNSAVGVWADGNNRYLRNENATGNTTGIKVTGNNNTVHNGAAVGNTGDGVWVSGSGNLLTDTNSMSNGWNGFFVTNAALPGNQLVKLDAGEKGTANGRDGVHVEGNGNTLNEIDAFANGWDGIEVLGSSNTLTKNVAGDKGKGNGQDGIRVVGTANSLVENKARTNTGDGFDVSGGTTGTGANKLKKNESNTGSSGATDYENGQAEFRLANFVKNDGGGNKADNIGIPKTSAPAKCATFPATNATSNAAIVCE